MAVPAAPAVALESCARSREAAWRQSDIGNDIELAVGVVGDHRPARGRNPVLCLANEPVGDLFRVERLVGFADGFDEGVAMVQPGA